MLGPAEDPPIGLFSGIALPVQGRDVNKQEVRKRVDIKEHVAAAGAAEPAVARRLSVEVPDLLLALRYRKRVPLDDRDDRHGTAARVRAIRAQAVMNLEGLLRVLVANRVLFAPTQDFSAAA